MGEHQWSERLVRICGSNFLAIRRIVWGQRQRGSSRGRGGRRRHRNNEATSSSGSAGSADRERRTQSLRAPSSSNSEGEEDSSVTLGPVSERIVMVRQGMNVVLECRDADADSRVYWTKHGGEYLLGRDQE